MASSFDEFFADARAHLVGFHGESLVPYQADGGTAAAADVTAIVGAVADDLIEVGPERTRYRQRFVTVQLSQVPNPRRPDKVTLDGEVWTVHEVPSRHAGLARLLCIRPERLEAKRGRVNT